MACAALVVLLALPAHAVSCANPDNLCRGNPCVTGPLEVSSPCVVDFGDRALVIKGTLKIENGGLLSLKAGSIDVRRPIIGRRVRRYGAGADIMLTAIRDITVRWRIDASGRTAPGMIQLVAGDDIDLLAPLRAAAKGSSPIAPGGTIAIDAGGTLKAAGRARIRTNGAATTPGGEVTLTAAQGIDLQNRISAGGSTGGRIVVEAPAGDIVLARRLDVSGSSGDGGSTIVAATTGSITAFDRIDAEGLVRGGTIQLIGGGPVTVLGALRSGSTVRNDTGGTVVVASDGDVSLSDVVSADGSSGGFILIASENGTARLGAAVVASGTRGAGGRVVLAGGRDAVIAHSVDADGGSAGGTISISGGAIALTSSGGLFARGNNGGTINVGAASVSVPAGARVLVDGDLPGGTITFDARDGDLVLDGDFRARGRTGGRIEGMASGDVVANGDFAARGNGGCIGLSAGSQLDISGGLFDVPVVDMCP